MSTVLIVGASRGIGLETVRLALKAGHSVGAVSERHTFASNFGESALLKIKI
jgi:NAD(P)-dependent dehydrogenase (short-subunit alcohol dehydrogenase family)